ncbi:MAG: Ig-like domain-containing protein [Chlorobium sp.]
MATYTKTGTTGNDFADLFTISGLSRLPVNGNTYVFDGLSGTDMLTLSVNNSYPYLGYFLSTNFTIPAVPDAFGQYVISGTIMSDIMVTLKLTSVEQLVFADKIVSLAYPGSIDATPPTIAVFNPPGILPTSSSISVTFSEPIQKGTGYVYLRGDGGYRADYNVATSPNLTISGSTITISPTTVFAADREYSVTFAAGSINDLAGNGCSNDTEYHFNTNSGSNTLPSPNPQIGFGKVATDFGGGYDFATTVTTQADGKILVAGASMNASIDGSDVALVRYNADGSLDTSFGGGDGRIATDFGYGDMSIWVSALNDGKILVVGESVINWGNDGKGILARYNADGTLDMSFDGDGKVITILDGMSGLYFGSGIVQKDGKIVVVGVVYTQDYDSNSFVVLRYNSDGSLDTSFDTDGVVITPIYGSDIAQHVVQQSDGKILVAGTSSNGVNNDIVLARYNVNGSLDISFNGNGIVITDFGGNEQLGTGNIGGGLAVQSDGKIFVAGQSDGNFVLLRYNSDGTLDKSFSGDGKVIVNLGYPVQPYSLVVQPDGKILVSGVRNTDVMFLRFNGDGTLDPTFFDNGKVIANIGSDLLNGSGVSGSTLQADGKILVSGQSNGDFGVVRFNADGTLDTTFGLSVNTAPAFSENRAGTITTDFGGEDTGRSVIVQGDGKILVAGTSAVAVNGGINYNLALARYTTDGTSVILDTTFGNGGKRTTDFGGNEYGRSVVELSDGKFLLAGSTTVANGTTDFVLACYNGDGTFDSTFASNGKVITDFSSTYDIANSIKVLSDGKILLAGTSGNDFALARYNSNGTPDPTFQGGGKFTTDFGGTESGMSVTVQSDGKILVAGTSTLPGGNADFALARYNVDGSLDTAFHGDGKLTTDFGGTESGQSVVVQSDGKIIVAGSSIAIMDGVAMLNSNFALVRYNADGSLDTSFHGDGRLTTDFGATTASGSSVLLQSDGKILVAGSSTKAGGKSDFALARYNTDGTLDASFSGDGRFTMDFGGSSDTCYSISIDGNGKILVAGTSDIDGNGDFAVARINTDGSLDATFGGIFNPVPTYMVNGAPVVLDSLIQIDDTELAIIGNFAGATLKFMRHDGAVVEDQFSNTGTLGNLTQGSDLVIDSIVVGTIITNAGGVLDVAFNANATQLLVNEVLQQIAYSNLSQSPASSVQVDWIFSDGNTGTQGSGGAMTDMSHTTVQFAPDTTVPTVTAFSPIDGVLGVTVDRDIVLTFSEAIQFGNGTIEIHNGSATGTIVASYDVATSTNITITGNTLAINPAADLTSATHYFVTFSDGSVKDLAGNRYAGTASYDFTTSDGRIITDFDGSDYGFGMAIQSDGKILVAGMGNGDFAVARYNLNGSLDTTFDTDGKVTTDLCGNDLGFSVAVQSDGKILVAGDDNYGNQQADFGLVRYNIDGSLDTSFSEDGKATIYFDACSNAVASNVTVQPDGKMLIGGSICFHSGNIANAFALVRCNNDGSLDTSFGTGGKVITGIGVEAHGYSLAVQTDGKILFAGFSGYSPVEDFALVRYNPDGSLDARFGIGGKVTTDFGGSDVSFKTTIQSDGKILLVGASNGDVALARYNSNGSLDTTFSGDGKVTADIGGGDFGFGMAVQSDGKILVSGYAYASQDGLDHEGSVLFDNGTALDFALLRYNADGTLDDTFGVGGKVTTDFGGTDYAFSVALQSDGKIVLSGGSNGDFAIARYNTDGSLDASFGARPNCIVTTTADSGTGSLRAAIEYLNASGGNDSNTIQFATSGTIVVDPDNPLPVITRHVSFVMNGNAVEVKLENAPVIDDIPAVVFVAESNVAVAIPEDLTVTVTDSHKSSGLGSYGTLVLNEMAGHVTVASDSGVVYGVGAWQGSAQLESYSGDIIVTGETIVVGLGAGVEYIATIDQQLPVLSADAGNFTITNDFSGQVTVTSAYGFAFGVFAIQNLTIGRGVTDTAVITVTVTEESPDDGVAIGAMNDLVINGDMAGTLRTTATEAGGIGSGSGSVRLGALSGTITVDGVNLANGIKAQSITITDSLSGDIAVDASRSDAEGLESRSGDLIIGGDLSGKVTVHAQSEAYGLKSSQAMMIGALSGDISATSEDNLAFGLWANGELHGGTATEMLTISGIVSAVGRNIAAGIVAGGAMNLNISGTVSGGTTDMNDAAYSILSTTNGTDSAEVSDQVTVTGTGKLVGYVNLGAGDDSMTLQAGADVTGVVLFDGGSGTDRLVLSGNAVVDLDAQSDKVRNFEIIDLTDAKHNTLAISSADAIVKATDADHDLSIVGDSGDIVTFSSSGATFTSSETKTIGGVAYAHYITSADATVDIYVQSDLVVEFGDATAPTVTTFSPADAATGVAVSSDITLTFSESVQKGSGLIEIHSGSATGTVVESFDAATSPNLTISGNTLTINPAANLASGMHYFVTLNEGSIKDLAGNTFAGTMMYDFMTEGVSPELHNLNGGVTFWKTGLPIPDVESSTFNSDIGFAHTLELRTQLIEFKNIQVATDGSRTIEIWETPGKSINSLQLAFTFSPGSVATWQDATGLPSGWISVINTEKPGQFILGGMGTTALPVQSVMLGTLTLTQPTNPDRFDLFLNAGWLGDDTVSSIGIASDSMITGADGLYRHLDMPEGTYALTSVKVSGTAESNAVKANDALAALKIAVGMNPNGDGSPVSPYQYLAADVNKDGQVKAADALNILKMAVKLDTAPAKEWLFVPESVGSEAMSRTHVVLPENPIPVLLGVDQDLHLIGIVKGDVNGSWVA